MPHKDLKGRRTCVMIFQCLYKYNIMLYTIVNHHGGYSLCDIGVHFAEIIVSTYL